MKPELETVIELNRKFGYGFQGRMILDGYESVIDNEPFTFGDAYAGAAAAIEQLNQDCGYGYEPHKVIRIANDGLQANRSRDFTAARVLRDIEQGRGELASPVGADYRKTMIDGQEEIALSGRGVILFTFLSWRDDKMPKAREAFRRYCEYLAKRKYGGSTTDIFDEVERMDTDRATSWIRATYGKYVTDDADLIGFIMG